MRAIRAEFGHRPEAVLIGHAERVRGARACTRATCRARRRSSRSTAARLVFERHGSLGIDDARAIAARHGLDLAIAPGAHARIPVRWPADDVLRAA